MFFDNSPHNKAKNKNVNLTKTQLPPPKQVELIDPYSIQGNPTNILDVECYPNYFEVGFKLLELETYVFFEQFEGFIYAINGNVVSFDIWCSALSFLLHRFISIGFNSIWYDLPLISFSLKGKSNQELKEYSNSLIQDRKNAYPFKMDGTKINHIDIMEVAPLHDGLKTYAGRIHVPRMQELPYEHWRVLTEEEMYYVRSYNVNDLDNTGLLYQELKGQIRLREKLGLRYGLDLRSKSDAQVAEAVVQSELNKLGIKVRRPSVQAHSSFHYTVPDFIQFKTSQLQNVLEVVRTTPFEVNEKGKTKLPKAISSLKIKIGETEYKFGLGGLHSKEKSAAYKATDKLLIIDRDVEGYYPNIILNQNLYPEHLGPAFCEVLRNLVNMRSECKANAKKYKSENNIEFYIYWDEESGSLKIATNGIFGKTSSEFSIVYSPKLTIQTTISGQLSLFMAVEQLSLAGFNVISANTDGIVTLVPTERKTEFDAIVSLWEKQTGFRTEETKYKALYSANVNNYIAIKDKREPNSSFYDEQMGCKTKGWYSERGSALNSTLSKNPETYICSMAVMNFLCDGVPIKETIENCKDIKRFVSVKKAEGGAQKDGQYLGKVLRWYYTEGETGTINYVGSGNSVGDSEGATPLMDLPADFPDNINYGWYIDNANRMLVDLGYYQKVKTGDMFN